MQVKNNRDLHRVNLFFKHSLDDIGLSTWHKITE